MSNDSAEPGRIELRMLLEDIEHETNVQEPPVLSQESTQFDTLAFTKKSNSDELARLGERQRLVNLERRVEALERHLVEAKESASVKLLEGYESIISNQREVLARKEEQLDRLRQEIADLRKEKTPRKGGDRRMLRTLIKLANQLQEKGLLSIYYERKLEDWKKMMGKDDDNETEGDASEFQHEEEFSFNAAMTPEARKKKDIEPPTTMTCEAQMEDATETLDRLLADALESQMPTHEPQIANDPEPLPMNEIEQAPAIQEEDEPMVQEADEPPLVLQPQEAPMQEVEKSIPVKEDNESVMLQMDESALVMDLQEPSSPCQGASEPDIIEKGKSPEEDLNSLPKSPGQQAADELQDVLGDLSDSADSLVMDEEQIHFKRNCILQAHSDESSEDEEEQTPAETVKEKQVEATVEEKQYEATVEEEQDETVGFTEPAEVPIKDDTINELPTQSLEEGEIMDTDESVQDNTISNSLSETGPRQELANEQEDYLVEMDSTEVTLAKTASKPIDSWGDGSLSSHCLVGGLLEVDPLKGFYTIQEKHTEIENNNLIETPQPVVMQLEVLGSAPNIAGESNAELATSELTEAVHGLAIASEQQPEDGRSDNPTQSLSEEEAIEEHPEQADENLEQNEEPEMMSPEEPEMESSEEPEMKSPEDPEMESPEEKRAPSFEETSMEPLKLDDDLIKDESSAPVDQVPESADQMVSEEPARDDSQEEADDEVPLADVKKANKRRSRSRTRRPVPSVTEEIVGLRRSTRAKSHSCVRASKPKFSSDEEAIVEEPMEYASEALGVASDDIEAEFQKVEKSQKVSKKLSKFSAKKSNGMKPKKRKSLDGKMTKDGKFKFGGKSKKQNDGSFADIANSKNPTVALKDISFSEELLKTTQGLETSTPKKQVHSSLDSAEVSKTPIGGSVPSGAMGPFATAEELLKAVGASGFETPLLFYATPNTGQQQQTTPSVDEAQMELPEQYSSMVQPKQKRAKKRKVTVPSGVGKKSKGSISPMPKKAKKSKSNVDKLEQVMAYFH